MTIATPSMVVIVVIMLPDAPNCALSHDFITVSNKSNFPIVMNADFVMAIYQISYNLSIITETFLGTVQSSNRGHAFLDGGT